MTWKWKKARGATAGGDTVKLKDIFGNPPEDVFKRAAGV